jgi:hypothetical protein
MPFWYNLTFLLTLAEVVIRWHESARLPVWIAASAVLWMLASAYSLLALVPVNNRTGADGICITAGVPYSSRSLSRV